MIPLATPDLRGNEGRYLQQCIDSTFISSVGQFVTQFETATAEAAGALGGVATSSGTAALHLALATLHIGHGDLVILPSYTFIASANAISMAGARPWLMDIEAESWTLDATRLRAALEEATHLENGRLLHRRTGERVAAIMPVHTLGHPADMDAIGQVAADFDLPVVADAAAAMGATCRDRPIGVLAQLSCLSFNGNKTVTCGGGGMVLSGDHDLLTRAAHLNTTARNGTAYVHDEAAFNYRMTNIQAAVGLAQIERLADLVAAKRRIFRRYAEALDDLPGMHPLPQASWAESACWFAGMSLDDPNRLRTLIGALNEAGIQARDFWVPMHWQPPYRGCPRAESLVQSEAIAPRVLTLPCSTHLSEDDQAMVIDRVRSIWQTG